jgi:UPF0271 protein
VKRIDLNVDIGEGFPFDRELLAFATSANVCCGEHAGSWELAQETVQHCLEAGVRIGMHPGYPDRENMGRASPASEWWPEFGRSTQAQVERFFFFVPAAYLKPHGALYHDAAGSGLLAEHMREVLRAACARFRLPLMGLPGTGLESVAASAKVEFIREGFADRAYRPDGQLVRRGEPGAVLSRPEEIRRQCVQLAKTVDSICIHGDTPGCVEFAEMVYEALVEAGYEVGA